MSRRDDEHREYRGDVLYDVWRSGGNPDAVDYDRVRDSFYEGERVEDAVTRELRAQRPPEPQMTEEEYLEEKYQDDEPQPPEPRV
jgi:hypothetical protein